MLHSLRLSVVPAYLLLCLILGGASAAGLWSNMALQLLAIPIIFWGIVVRRGSPTSTSGRQLLILLVLMITAIALQLIPLPPSIWTALPGRDIAARGFQLADLPLPWLPLSLAPQATLSSALWLLPAIAALLGVLRAGAYKSAWIAWVIILTAVISVMIGALQIVGGEDSPWYFYEITNYGTTTGFFSNSNHMATLLVVSLPFLAALYLGARGRGRSAQRASGLLVIVFGAVAVTVVGLAINRSLAGVALTVPVALSSFLMIWSRKGKLPLWAWVGIGGLLVAALAAAATQPFNSSLAAEEAQQSTNSRAHSFSLSWTAAQDFAPIGSGIGTFIDLYPRYEEPAKIGPTYMNHVHNDYIELWLETGIVGAVLLLLFLAWWFRRAFAIWRSEERDFFARAATIATAAILAHSFVDYPLRTAAISAIFAVCCALMAEPRPRVRRSEPVRKSTEARHLEA